jgi:hypothetical protein
MFSCFDQLCFGRIFRKSTNTIKSAQGSNWIYFASAVNFSQNPPQLYASTKQQYTYLNDVKQLCLVPIVSELFWEMVKITQFWNWFFPDDKTFCNSIALYVFIQQGSQQSFGPSTCRPARSKPILQYELVKVKLAVGFSYWPSGNILVAPLSIAMKMRERMWTRKIGMVSQVWDYIYIFIYSIFIH